MPVQVKILSILFSSFIITISSCSSLSQNKDYAENQLANLPMKTLIYPEKIPTSFQKKLDKSSQTQFFQLIVEFKCQLDLMEYGKTLNNLPSKSHRRQTVIQALSRISKKYSGNLRDTIRQMETRGIARSPRFLSIFNGVTVYLTKTGVYELIPNENVARIIPSFKLSFGAGNRKKNTSGNKKLNIEFYYQWWPMALNIKKLWNQGINGKDVIVGILDTGVFGDHEQLKGKNLPPPRGWFDPYRGKLSPYDSSAHGTEVLSCAVGKNPGTKIVGVAPKAKWIAALGLFANFYSNVKMAECADWILNVGQPDVLICPWGHYSGTCNDLDRVYLDAWKAAEIFCLFAAGNTGPAPYTDHSPANLTSLYPGDTVAFSVGGIAYAYQAYEKSSRGPNSCNPYKIYPLVSAPAREIYCASSKSFNAYTLENGTSHAVGLAGGMVALLVQKYPNSSVDELQNLLLQYTKDLGPPGPDNTFGYGLIQFPIPPK